MNTNRDIKRYWTPENTTEEKQTRGIILNTDEVLFNVDDLEDRISEIENFLRTAFDGSVLKEAFGGTDNSQWVDFLEDLSVRLNNAVLTQNDDNSYLFVGNTNNSGKFNFSSLWNWIVSKLSSVFGLVRNNETGKVTLSADITGDVTGNVTGDVTGNAGTATLADMAEKVCISTSSSNANFLLASIDNDAIVNGETPKRVSLKFNETTKELSSGDKVFASLEDVNSITAKYITSSVDGAAFADEAALQGTLYYAGQEISTQTTPALGDNDYCIVLDSGFYHDHSTARYVYQNGVWTFQYKVSQVTLTQAQLDALNSGITSSDVTKLSGIETGAEVNVQSDWNETDSSADSYIKNKPILPSVSFTYVVDTDKKLEDWANNVEGNDYTSVLIRGQQSISNLGINLTTTGTKVIVGETGSKIISTNDSSKYLFQYDNVPTTPDYFIFNLNVQMTCPGTGSVSVIWYRCSNLKNCIGELTQSRYGRIFGDCTNIEDCLVVDCVGSGSGYGFQNCYSVRYCKVLASSSVNTYLTSYSSPTAISGYECANTLEGGWNTTT